jgi:hypothetical protein
MTLEIMTPESPRWAQFIDLLNEIGEERGCVARSSENRFRCAKEAMSRMGGIDIEKSVAFFWELGGHCDCEIVLNVDGWGDDPIARMHSIQRES